MTGVVMAAGSRVSMESPHSSEINEESDNDADYLDEYESEEERRTKRKKKVGFMFSRCVVVEVTVSSWPTSPWYVAGLRSPPREPLGITRKINPMPVLSVIGATRLWQASKLIIRSTILGNSCARILSPRVL